MLRNDHHHRMSYEIADALYDIQLAVAAMKPLSKQAEAVQKVHSENGWLKAALIENTRAHIRALNHLIEVLPEGGDRLAYQHGVEVMKKQLASKEEEWR